MGQRKLTPRQIEHAKQAAQSLADGVTWDYTPDGDGYWMSVFDKLVSMAQHGTNDGKPWTEPQPEIGNGYRLATLSDAHRRDRQVWCDGFWLNAQIGHTETNRVYSVPIDRIPTDEDAKQRPTVMVRDADGQPWKERRMVAVLSERFYAISLSGRHVQTWMQARFPYPGELD